MTSLVRNTGVDFQMDAWKGNPTDNESLTLTMLAEKSRRRVVVEYGDFLEATNESAGYDHQEKSQAGTSEALASYPEEGSETFLERSFLYLAIWNMH